MPLQPHGMDADVDPEAAHLAHLRLHQEVAAVDEREAAHLPARLVRSTHSYGCGAQEVHNCDKSGITVRNRAAEVVKLPAKGLCT